MLVGGNKYYTAQFQSPKNRVVVVFYLKLTNKGFVKFKLCLNEKKYRKNKKTP